MKRFLTSILTPVLLYSCSANKEATSRFYYVDAFKEQEMRLYLNDDQTFKLQDNTGCNQFTYTGRYKKETNHRSESYLIFDSVKLTGITATSSSDDLFHLATGDTSFILNRERLSISGDQFKAIFRGKVDLRKIRFEKLKEYYTDRIGEEQFRTTFGGGKGMKEARKFLERCPILVDSSFHGLH